MVNKGNSIHWFYYLLSIYYLKNINNQIIYLDIYVFKYLNGTFRDLWTAITTTKLIDNLTLRYLSHSQSNYDCNQSYFKYLNWIFRVKMHFQGKKKPNF